MLGLGGNFADKGIGTSLFGTFAGDLFVEMSLLM